jgi:carboxymethylenebutenolidase
MKDDKRNSVSRREFGALSVGAGLAATASMPAVAADMQVIETNVVVKTPDGMCDAVFVYPSQGAHPGVIIWTDVFGLRPAMRGFARRIAAEGYSVLVPNPFYRTAKAPVFNDPQHTFDFANQADMAKIPPLTGPLNAAGATERDSIAYVAFLDAQSQVDKAKKIGTQGYCMGGPLVVKTCAANANRVGAGGSFHGGGLVTADANSPHLLAPKIKARMYFGIAANDDMRQPDQKDKLKEAFAAAKVPAEIEVYKSLHGWCVPDMPGQNGASIYNYAEGEKAWGKLVALYKTALA